MISLGTSHTAGECDETNLELTFADYIAEDLGLELIKIGLPGCDNLELLFAFNKLLRSGIITDENMKLFIFEPRIIDVSGRIPLEAVIDDNDLENILDSLLEHDIHIHHEYFTKEFISFSLYYYGGTEDIDQWIKDGIDAIYNFTGYKCKPHVYSNKALSDYSKYIINHSSTFMQQANNLALIESVLNHLKYTNKNYFWLTFNFMGGSLLDKIIKKYYNENLENTLLMHTIIEKFKDIDNGNLLCECEHMNEYGHKHLYNLIIDKIKEGYYDKTT